MQSLSGQGREIKREWLTVSGAIITLVFRRTLYLKNLPADSKEKQLFNENHREAQSWYRSRNVKLLAEKERQRRLRKKESMKQIE